MSYTLIQQTPPNLAAALDLMCPANVSAATRALLAAQGHTVKLDTGDFVFVSCVPQDDPKTRNACLYTVAMAVDTNGAILRQSGIPIGVDFWHTAHPADVVANGLPAIRKALMLIAIGEPQTLLTGLDTMFLDERSVRMAITVCADLGAALTAVL